MIIGHYGPAFAVKGKDSSIPLWVLILAVQFVDVLWAIFILVGAERLRIVPGYTASNHLELLYIPLSHSLLAALVWSGLVGLGYRWCRGNRRREGCKATPPWWKESAALVAVAAATHWFFDLVVHTPDLPLIDDIGKVGMGLWDYRWATIVLEAALLFGGLAYYLARTRATSPFGRYGMVVFCVVLMATQIWRIFQAPPTSPRSVAVEGLLAYFGIAAVAWCLDLYRDAKPTNETLPA